jgi:putative DNA primase/helicase
LPIVLNGIVEVITAGDLQDRSITLMLPTINEYTPEEEMWQDFERVRPRLLGVLLDVVSVALANERTIRLERPPRMADFAHWIAAAASALGWEASDLLKAYAANRATANETTLEASPLVTPLRSLGVFEGTATALLAELSELAGENVPRSKAWLKSPSALSGELRRLAPSLRRAEPPLLIEFERDASGRTIRISPPKVK